MTTKAIAPSDIAIARQAKQDHTFENIVARINQRLIDNQGGYVEFNFNRGTAYELICRVQDAFSAQDWDTELWAPQDEDGTPRYTLKVMNKKAAPARPTNTEELLQYFAETHPWARVDVAHRSVSGGEESPSGRIFQVCISGSPVDGCEKGASERVSIDVHVESAYWDELVDKAIAAVDRCRSWVHSPLQVEEGLKAAFTRGAMTLGNALVPMPGGGCALWDKGLFEMENELARLLNGVRNTQDMLERMLGR